MFKTVILSTVAAASLLLFQAEAIITDEEESSSASSSSSSSTVSVKLSSLALRTDPTDSTQPIHAPHAERAAKLHKLYTQLQTRQKILAKEQQSKGLRRNKFRKIDHAWTRVQELEHDIQKIEKSMPPLVLEKRKENWALRSTFQAPSLKYDQESLKHVFNQPLMEGLLLLASPFGRDERGEYLSHGDIFNLMEALFPLKGDLVRNTNWLACFPSYLRGANADPKGLTAEEFDYFWKGTIEGFKKIYFRKLPLRWGSLPTSIDSGQVGAYLIMKGTKQEERAAERTKEGFEVYKNLIEIIQTHNPQNTGLQIYDKQLTVLPPSLSQLTALNGLDLSQNQIADVSALAGLVNLQTLGLSQNQIADVSALAGLVNLQRLYLSQNQIADVRPLAGLVNLWELWLEHTQIVDVSALAGLVNLQTLYLSQNQIADVRPLAGLAKLQRLDLSQNQIADVSALAGLAKLCELYLHQNQIADVRPLAGLVNLQTLYLHQNQIADVRPLAGLVNLQTLYLSQNQIADVSALAGLVNLWHLDLSLNQIADVRPLAGLVNLQTLYLSQNQIADVSALAGLVNLQRLYLSQNQIADVRPLAGLVNLRELYLSRHPHLWSPLPSENPEVARARIATNMEAVKTLRDRRCIVQENAE